MKYTVRTKHNGPLIEFEHSDIVNPSDHIPTKEYNPHNVRPFALVHTFGTVAVAFGYCESDAIDTIADSGKLEPYRVMADELADCTEEKIDEFICAGNADEYFHQEYLQLFELPNPVIRFQWEESK